MPYAPCIGKSLAAQTICCRLPICPVALMRIPPTTSLRNPLGPGGSPREHRGGGHGSHCRVRPHSRGWNLSHAWRTTIASRLLVAPSPSWPETDGATVTVGCRHHPARRSTPPADRSRPCVVSDERGRRPGEPIHLFPTNFGQSALNSVKVQPISTLRLPNHARPAAELPNRRNCLHYFRNACTVA